MFFSRAYLPFLLVQEGIKILCTGDNNYHTNHTPPLVLTHHLQTKNCKTAPRVNIQRDFVPRLFFLVYPIFIPGQNDIPP